MSGFSGIYQHYETRDVANLQLALYTLSIRSPKAPYPVFQTYTFPISPQSVRKQITAMSSLYDVQGSVVEDGVHRIVDQYGNSPVTFTLSGTTGWKTHNSDGYKYTGLQSITAVQKLLNLFSEINQEQRLNNQRHLFTLEFMDYFSGDYWEVIPIGEQEVRLDSAQPLFTYYNFRLAGVRPLSNPPPKPVAPDPISQMMGTVASNVMGNLKGFATLLGNAYNEIAGVIPGL
jgi:hypothetical protein